MKKILAFTILLYCASCSNPEDKATGNADSTSFNNSKEKVLNSRPGPTDPNGQTDVAKPDTSVSPSTLKDNTKTPTNGTNRPYGSKADSSSKKQ